MEDHSRLLREPHRPPAYEPPRALKLLPKPWLRRVPAHCILAPEVRMDEHQPLDARAAGYAVRARLQHRMSWAMLAPGLSPARQIRLLVPAGVRGHPSEGRHGVVVVCGERVLGREAVVHRHGKHAGAGHEGVDKVVVGGGEGRADDEAAAMHVDE